jgi:hypothetical protein
MAGDADANWPGIYELDPLLIGMLDHMARHGWDMAITALIEQAGDGPNRPDGGGREGRR